MFEPYCRANRALRPTKWIRDVAVSSMVRRERPRRRWPRFVAAVAAVLAIVLLADSLIPDRPGGPVPALKAYAISEPKYPAYPSRINSRGVERMGYFGEYQEYRSAWGDLEESFAALVGDFSGETAGMLLAGEEENVLYSPVSFWIALAMLAETTGGSTREEILAALGVADIETLRQQTKAMWQRIYNDNGVAATKLGSSIWVNDSMPVRQEALDNLAEHYYAGSYAVEMGAEEADQAIAAWINAQTEGLLEKSTSKIKTDGITIMQLYSTLYYYGGWGHEFSPGNNTEDLFTRADGSQVTTTFMNKKDEHSVLGGDTFIAGLMSTENTGIYFVLPDEGKTVDDVLADPTLWEGLWDWQRWVPRKIEWSVPKFDVDSDIDLKETMRELGIGEVFEMGSLVEGEVDEGANFDPLIDGSYLPYLTTAHQAARLQVDEKGIKAVAYTEMGVNTGAAPPPDEVVELVLNRPFLVIVASGVNGVPLFVGEINDPTG